MYLHIRGLTVLYRAMWHLSMVILSRSSIPPSLYDDSLMELSVSLNFRGQAGPMTNRGVFLEKYTQIDWSNHLTGDLIALIVCVPRCVVPPLFLAKNL